MANAKRDENFVPTLLGVSSSDGVTPVEVWVDPVTHRLLVDVSGASGTGDVVGPASSTDNAIARYDGTTGKLLQNSAVVIADTTGNMSGMQQITVGTVGGATGIYNLRGTTSGTISITANAVAGTYTWVLPAAQGGAGTYLKNDGSGNLSWDTPSGGGSGTVTTVSVATANGFSGSVANATTTPAITISTTQSGILAGVAGALVGRTLTGTTDQITVTNGDGASGDPTISLPASPYVTGGFQARGSGYWFSSASSWQILGSTNFGASLSVGSSNQGALGTGYSFARFSIHGSTITTAASGTHTLIAGGAIKPPVISNGGATVTNTATWYIEDAPSGGTNNYAVWVDAGVTRLDGATWFGATVLPFSNDGAALGTASFSFSDLFLASGGVINWNNGTFTLTQSSTTLTASGTISAAALVSTSNTINLSSATLTRSGAHTLTLTTTGATNVTLPTTGTLSTLAGSETFSSKTIALGSNTVSGTIAEFNAALTDGDFATLAGSEILSNKTLTAPKFADLGFIADANGNEMLIFDTVASAVNEFTFVNAASGNSPEIRATGSGTDIDIKLVPKGAGIVKGERKIFQVRLKDNTTALTTGTSIGGDFRISPLRAITIKAVGAYVDTAATGATLLTIDINEAGTTILSTKITLDASEKTSTTAATPAVISDSSIAADAVITFDIDAIGNTTPGTGLVVWVEYEYA